jgi:ABC-type multidrug transport system fused ATPase/permease subunit
MMNTYTADGMLVFDRGEIKVRGTYKKLVEHGRIFKTLHEKQASEDTS